MVFVCMQRKEKSITTKLIEENCGRNGMRVGVEFEKGKVFKGRPFDFFSWLGFLAVSKVHKRLELTL